MAHLIGYWIGFIAVIAGVLLAVFGGSIWFLTPWALSIAANFAVSVKDSLEYFQ